MSHNKIKRGNKQNTYHKLRASIMLRTILITAITGAIGVFVLVYFVDGIFQDYFPVFFVKLLEQFNVPQPQAVNLYWRIIGDNKTIIVILFFVILFLLIFSGALRMMTHHLDIIGESIDNVAADSDDPIALVPELKPIEDKLNDLKKSIHRRQQEAIESEKKKNDLVLFLAHDLKTPLTSVIAYLSMLESNPDMSPDDRMRYSHIALEKSVRLGELIQEFFEITRYNLEDIVLEKKQLNLSMMLEQLADEMFAVLNEKQMTCKVYTDEDIIIYGDPDKLARVFDNLLRNAVTYSFSGTEISIYAREVGEWIEIVFANKGNTIPQEGLETIFEKFYRMDDSRSSRTGGAGLGLAIAKEIVELHDGTISATSEEGETRFIVVMPQQEASEREQKAKRLEKRIEDAIKEEKIRVPASTAETDETPPKERESI